MVSPSGRAPKCIPKHYHTHASITPTYGAFWAILKWRQSRNMKELFYILLLTIEQTEFAELKGHRPLSEGRLSTHLTLSSYWELQSGLTSKTQVEQRVLGKKFKPLKNIP